MSARRRAPDPKESVPASGSLLIWHHGHVLAVSRHGKPHDLGLPGGKVEKGETPLEAAVRETQEETGLPLDRIDPNPADHGLSSNVRLEWDDPIMDWPYKLTLRLVYHRAGGTPSGRVHFVYEGRIADCPPLTLYEDRRRPADQDLTVAWVTVERLLAHTNSFSGFNRGLFAHLGFGEARGI